MRIPSGSFQSRLAFWGAVWMMVLSCALVHRPTLAQSSDAPVRGDPAPPARGGLPIPPRLLKLPHLGAIDIRMKVIHATNSVDGFDPAIRNLQRHLSFLNYKGFRLLFSNAMSLRPRMTRSLGLFDGNVIEVTLNSATQEKVELRIRMYHPRAASGVALDTSVSVARKGTFFVGGPSYQDGVLVLPITAWY